MATYATRSLRKASEKLTEADERFLERFTCGAQGCGKDFVFEITRGAQEQAEQKLRRYHGRCGFCGKQITLNNSQYKKWCLLIAGSELRVLDSTFDQLFDTK